MHLDEKSPEDEEENEHSQGESEDSVNHLSNSTHMNGTHREYRSRPVVHAPVDPPLCVSCMESDAFFSVSCGGCRALITSKETSIAHLFSILRQWTPQAQQALELIVTQMLNIGAHVDDRDGLTDMTMLHYASKAGTRGIGDMDQACRVVSLLLTNCADPYLRCRWTNMAAIHYATYFDVAPVVTLLLNATKAVDVDSPCSEFDHGSPLHIAARNLCVDSALRLLEVGADPQAKDIDGKTPLDWLPTLDSFQSESETSQLVATFHKILSEAKPLSDFRETLYQQSEEELDTSLRILQGSGVSIGDKVIVGGIKTGILRYCGQTRFSSGLWAGVELDEPVGKNNGSVAGIRYFKCPPNYGIFAPLNKISKPGILLRRGISSLTAAGGASNGPISGSVRNISRRKVNVNHVTARVNTGLKSTKSTDDKSEEAVMGDRVLVAGRRCGVVRYVGETQFSPGIWYGIELDKSVGKNDGSVNNVRYFECEANRGVFAPPSRVERLRDDSFEAEGESLDSTHSVNSAGRLTNQNSEECTPARVVSRVKSSKSGPVFNASFSSAASPLSTSFMSANSPLKLTMGMNVLCSGEIGIVRYIGGVEFAEGLWIGIELRQAKGKHDGVVQGQRYFTCKPGHGLLVRPNRVTVRGINASKLLD